MRYGKYHLLRQYPCADPNCGKDERAAICRLHFQRLADPAMQGYYGDRSHYKFTEPGKWSLFDLSVDLHEDRNIADAKTVLVEKMARHVDQWWTQFTFGE